MTTPQYRDCPACGLSLPRSETAPDTRYNASPECWQLYGELTAYTVTRGDLEFIHQHLVDAYAAQHVRDDGRPISAAFALIGLYLACERGYTGKQVQHMHMLLANRSKTWPTFTPPSHMHALTIQDVLHVLPGENRDHMLHQWAKSVWNAWTHEHDRVKSLFATVMGD